MKNVNIITIQKSEAKFGSSTVVRQFCWFPVNIFVIVMGILVLLYFGKKYYFRESNIIFITTIAKQLLLKIVEIVGELYIKSCKWFY